MTGAATDRKVVVICVIQEEERGYCLPMSYSHVRVHTPVFQLLISQLIGADAVQRVHCSIVVTVV